MPIVATGRGGPLDLVRMGVDGWLYRPGDLGDLRMRVTDLVGDGRKRRAFGAAGRAAVEGRSWQAVCDQLQNTAAFQIAMAWHGNTGYLSSRCGGMVYLIRVPGQLEANAKLQDFNRHPHNRVLVRYGSRLS